MPISRPLSASLASITSLAVAFALGSCSTASPSAGAATSAQGSTTATSSAPVGATPSTTASGRTVEVTVKGSTITPAPATIPLKVGETINVVVTSDHDDEVHAHGFEVEKEIKAGVPVTLQLKGDVPGVYEVEMHHPALTLLQIAVS